MVGQHFKSNPLSSSAVYDAPMLIASFMAKKEVFWKLAKGFLGKNMTQQMVSFVINYYDNKGHHESNRS
jgi:hypothetical protein